MQIIKTRIPDLLIIKPRVFEDERGYFFESFNRKEFLKAGIDIHFVQDNESKSQKGVLRGLHFQYAPHQQGKLVRVVHGAVLDIAVDIRKDSPCFGQWESALLSAENRMMYWIPPGFAHGFVAQEENSIVSYKCTNFYNKKSEGCIRWDDPELNVDWGIKNPVLSEKDKSGIFFSELKKDYLAI